MESHLLEIVERTASYLETRMREPVDLDDVSRNVGVSKFHLLRVWKGATSTGIMEYVRRRRLALSLADLLRRGRTVDFISSVYAFGSERAYNRAFKEEFGLTPTRWRRRPRPLDVLEAFHPGHLARSGAGLLGARAARALPAFTVAGIEVGAPGSGAAAIRQGLRFFYEQRKRIANPVRRDVYYGVKGGPDADDAPELASIEVGPDSIVPPGFATRSLGPFTYAVFRYMGPHDPRDIDPAELKALWDRASGTWRPAVPRGAGEGFAFERIDFSRCSRQYCECELYSPIRGLEDGARTPAAFRGEPSR